MIDVEWNKQVITIIEKEQLSPPIVARSLSILYKGGASVYNNNNKQIKITAYCYYTSTNIKIYPQVLDIRY